MAGERKVAIVLVGKDGEKVVKYFRSTFEQVASDTKGIVKKIESDIDAAAKRSAERLRKAAGVGIFDDAIKQAQRLRKEIEQMNKLAVGIQPNGLSPSLTGTPRRRKDPLLDWALEDLKKYQLSSAQIQKDITRQYDREARAQAQVQIGEARRARAEVKKINETAIRELHQARNASSSAGGFLDSALGGSALGSLVAGGAAGVASSAINQAIGLVTSLTGEIKDLGVQAIQTGGDFEVTVNSMKVFTGSVFAAKSELASLAELSRRTPGLGLIEAEQGATRLRALGFEAQTTKDLLVGISKQKILSGADEGAVGRVIVNLTQLNAGSSRVSSDIKEMIMAMPTLRSAFVETFGSINKFKAALKKDPDEAFKKLAKGLADTEAAAGGLNDAWSKMQDQITLSQRVFAEPIIDPLTLAVKDLTNYLGQNKEKWNEWGQYVGDVITGVKDVLDRADLEVKNRPSSNSPEAMRARGEAEAAKYQAYADQNGGRGLISFLKYQYNQQVSLAEDFEERRKKGFSGIGRDIRNPKPDLSEQPNINKDLKSPAELAELKLWQDASAPIIKFQEELEAKKARRAENRRLQEIVDLKESFSNQNAIYEAGYQVQLAKQDSFLTYTLQDEKKQLTSLTGIRADYFKSESSRQSSYYNRLIGLADGDSDEIKKIEAEKNKTLTKINADFIIDSYKQQKQLAQLEQQIFSERRQNAIEFNSIQSQQAQLVLDTYTFDFNQAVSQGGGVGLYDGLIKATESAYQETSRLSRSSLQLQLDDLNLSEEKKKNIREQGALSEKQLAEKNRQDIINIQRNKAIQVSQSIQEMYSFIQKDITDQSQRFETYLEAVFGGGLVSSKSLSNVTNQIAAANAQQFANQKIALATSFAYSTKQDEINTAEAALRQKYPQKKGVYTGGTPTFMETGKIADLKNELKALGKASYDADTAFAVSKIGLVEFDSQIQDFAKFLNSNLGDVTIFDQLDAKILNQKRITALTVLDAQISEAREKANSITGSNQDKAALTLLERQRGNVAAEFFKQEQEQRSRSIVGLREQIELLEKGDAVTMAYIRSGQERNILEGRISDLTALYNKETEAVIALNRAQLELSQSSKYSRNQVRAQVYSQIAGEVGNINQTLADGIISAFQKGVDYLDKRLGKLGDIPILGDLAKFANRQAVGSLTTSLMNAFLPKSVVDQFNYDKNPLLGEAKQQNQKLDQIIANTGKAAGVLTGSTSVPGASLPSGAGMAGSTLSGLVRLLPMLATGANGPGGTPNFNPNAGSGTGSGSGSLLGNLGANGGLLKNWKNIFSTKDGGLFGKGGIFGEEGFGNNNGTYGAIGAGAGLLGSLIGGRGGRALSYAGTGLATGAQIGTMIAPGIGTAIGAGVGAIAGGLYGLFSNPGRKEDEATRTSAYTAVLSEFDKMIVSLKRVPPGMDYLDAQINASQILSEYNSAMSQLKDSKTRKIALAEVTSTTGIIYRKKQELDAAVKIAETNSAMIKKNQGFVGQFATGAYISDGFMSQYSEFKKRNGMLGSVSGWTGRDTLPSMLAIGEMVLNPKQIDTVRYRAGFDVFDGVVPNYQPKAELPKFAGGVSFNASSFSAPAAAPSVVINIGDITIGEGNNVTKEEVKQSIEEALGSRLFTDAWLKRKKNYENGRWV